MKVRVDKVDGNKISVQISFAPPPPSLLLPPPAPFLNSSVPKFSDGGRQDQQLCQGQGWGSCGAETWVSEPEQMRTVSTHGREWQQVGVLATHRKTDPKMYTV